MIFDVFLALAFAGPAHSCTALLEQRRRLSTERLETELHATEAKPTSLAQRLALSKLVYYQALMADEGEARQQLLDRAMALVDGAKKEAPDDPGALIGFAAARGELARRAPAFTALRYAREIRDALVALKIRYPAYEGYAADRGLGIVYEETPGFLSFGSRRKSREAIEAAMKGAPEHPGNQVTYAELLSRWGKKEEATTAAKQALEGAGAPAYALEAFVWTRQACAILGP